MGACVLVLSRFITSPPKLKEAASVFKNGGSLVEVKPLLAIELEFMTIAMASGVVAATVAGGPI